MPLFLRYQVFSLFLLLYPGTLPSTWFYCPHTPFLKASFIKWKIDPFLVSKPIVFSPPRYTCLTGAGIYTQVRTCDIDPPVFNRSWDPTWVRTCDTYPPVFGWLHILFSVISIFLIFKFSLLLNKIHCVSASHFHKSFNLHVVGCHHCEIVWFS